METSISGTAWRWHMLYFDTEMRKPGVTRQLFWMEYRVQTGAKRWSTRTSAVATGSGKNTTYLHAPGASCWQKARYRLRWCWFWWGLLTVRIRQRSTPDHPWFCPCNEISGCIRHTGNTGFQAVNDRKHSQTVYCWTSRFLTDVPFFTLRLTQLRYQDNQQTKKLFKTGGIIHIQQRNTQLFLWPDRCPAGIKKPPSGERRHNTSRSKNKKCWVQLFYNGLSVYLPPAIIFR